MDTVRSLIGDQLKNVWLSNPLSTARGIMRLLSPSTRVSDPTIWHQDGLSVRRERVTSRHPLTLSTPPATWPGHSSINICWLAVVGDGLIRQCCCFSEYYLPDNSRSGWTRCSSSRVARMQARPQASRARTTKPELSRSCISAVVSE